MRNPMLRQPLEIRGWLVRNGYKIVHIAREIGVTPPLVHRTITGEVNNRRVLRALLGLGCPKEFLALPPDLSADQVA